MRKFWHSLFGHQTRKEQVLSRSWTDRTEHRLCSCGTWFYWEPLKNVENGWLRYGYDDTQFVKENE